MTTLPDYAVSPGDHIKEWLDDHGINAAELARRLDVTPKHVSELVSGKAPLSATVALGLERVTGIPARIWNRFEAGYREDLARWPGRSGSCGRLSGIAAADLVRAACLRRGMAWCLWTPVPAAQRGRLSREQQAPPLTRRDPEGDA